MRVRDIQIAAFQHVVVQFHLRHGGIPGIDLIPESRTAQPAVLQEELYRNRSSQQQVVVRVYRRAGEVTSARTRNNRSTAAPDRKFNG